MTISPEGEGVKVESTRSAGAGSNEGKALHGAASRKEASYAGLSWSADCMPWQC